MIGALARAITKNALGEFPALNRDIEHTIGLGAILIGFNAFDALYRTSVHTVSGAIMIALNAHIISRQKSTMIIIGGF